MTAVSERRYKRVIVNSRLILEALVRYRNPPQWMQFAEHEIPEDVVVINYRQLLDPSGLELLLAHPSWDVVPLGAEVPRLISDRFAKWQRAPLRQIFAKYQMFHGKADEDAIAKTLEALRHCFVPHTEKRGLQLLSIIAAYCLSPDHEVTQAINRSCQPQ